MRTIAAALASLVPALASADTGAVAAHVTAGQDRARAGDYAGAIREFEDADHLAPRASHACLIGLAELRRHEPGQAEVWFAQCRARATPEDPLPAWLAASEGELAAQVAQLGAVTLAVEPAAADAVLAIDGWDAPFLPRTVHLAPGRYRVTARAPGQAAATADVVVTGAEAQQVTVRFAPPPAAPPPAAPPPAAPPPVAPPRARSTYWLGAGAAAIVAAGVVDVTAVRITYDRLDQARDGTTYDHEHTAYAIARGTTVALLVGGAAALAVGAIFHHDERDASAAPRVGASVRGGEAVMTLEWSR